VSLCLGWSGIGRCCPTTSSYFRAPQYGARDSVRTPSWPQSRLSIVRPPVAYSQFPTSTSRCGPPLPQFYGSPAPPYPLVPGNFLDVRGGPPRPHSGWTLRPCHRDLSPTVEELSPAMTTPRVPLHGVDDYLDWDHQHRRGSALRGGPRHCSGDGQRPSVDSATGRLDQCAATAMPWSTLLVRLHQSGGLGSTVDRRRYPSSTQWHIAGSDTQHETF